MKVDEFRSIYRDDVRCTVTYRDKDGYTRKGVALDGPKKSLTGKYFVNVDSFVNSVRMEDVVKLEPTETKW